MNYAGRFPAGIFWDPREPPPPEMRIHSVYQRWYTVPDSSQASGSVEHSLQAANQLPQTFAFPVVSPNPAGGTPTGSTPPAAASSVRGTAPTLTSTPQPTARPVKPEKLFPEHAVGVPGNGAGEPFLCVLVPLSVSIRVRVINDAAKMTLTQLYFNDSDRAIEEGGYTFPLPHDATVTAFSCKVGRDRVLRGQIKPKEEAKAAFTQAVRDRLTAGLLEEKTSEIFSTSLGNIPARTKVKVELSFVSLLKRRFDMGGRGITTTLTIPTCIAPRYGDIPEDLRLSQMLSDVARGLSLEVEISDCEKMTSISSMTHNIIVERGLASVTATSWSELTANVPPSNPDRLLGDSQDEGQNNGGMQQQQTESTLVRLKDGSTCLDRDFVLDLRSEMGDGSDNETPHAVLEIHPTLKDQAALMLTIPPRLLLKGSQDVPPTGPGSSEREIVFLADHSGSMDDKIASLRSAMHFFLKGIPQGRKFNVWCFGDGFTHLWPRSVDYTEHSLKEALDFVQHKFRADMGGTNLLPALRAIANSRGPFVPMDVIVLTDGEVWHLEETLSFVRTARSQSEERIRFFALGIGSAVSHALVEGIATAGGGYSEVVPANHQVGWEDRVVAMVRAALVTRIGGFRIDLEFEFQSFPSDMPEPLEIEGEATDRHCDLPQVLQSPSDISKLNPFQQHRVFVLFNSTPKFKHLRGLVIRADDPDGAKRNTSLVIQRTGGKEDFLHALAAKAVLEECKSAGSDTTRSTEQKIASRFSIISQHTSYFLVEDNIPRDQSENCVKSHITPVSVAGVLDGLDMLRPRGLQTYSRSGRSYTVANSTMSSLCLSAGTELVVSCARAGTASAYVRERSLVLQVSGSRVARGIDFAKQIRGQRRHRRQREFVRRLLDSQNFDGSFDSGSDDSHGSLLDLITKQIKESGQWKFAVGRTQAANSQPTDSTRAGGLHIPDKAATALMVVGLLEKHFQECNELWQLMVIKARGYVEKEVSDKNLIEGFALAWQNLMPSTWEWALLGDENDEEADEETEDDMPSLELEEEDEASGMSAAPEPQKLLGDQTKTGTRSDRVPVEAPPRGYQ